MPSVRSKGKAGENSGTCAKVQGTAERARAVKIIPSFQMTHRRKKGAHGV